MVISVSFKSPRQGQWENSSRKDSDLNFVNRPFRQESQKKICSHALDIRQVLTAPIEAPATVEACSPEAADAARTAICWVTLREAYMSQSPREHRYVIVI